MCLSPSHTQQQRPREEPGGGRRPSLHFISVNIPPPPLPTIKYKPGAQSSSSVAFSLGDAQPNRPWSPSARGAQRGPEGRQGGSTAWGHVPRAGTAPVGGLRPPLSYRYCEGRGGPGQGSHGEQLTVHEHGRSTPCAPGGCSSSQPQQPGALRQLSPCQVAYAKTNLVIAFFGGRSHCSGLHGHREAALPAAQGRRSSPFFQRVPGEPNEHQEQPCTGGGKGRRVWDLPQPRLVPGGSHSPAVGSQCPAAAGGGAVCRAKQGAARLRSSPPGQQRARQRPALLGVRTRGSQSSARLTPCWQTPALPGQHQGRSPQPQRKEEDRFWAAGQAGRAGRLGRASPSVPRAQVLFPCSCSKSTMASWERDPTPSRLLCTQRW